MFNFVQLSRSIKNVVYPVIGLVPPVLKEYQALYQSCTLRTEKLAELALITGRIREGRARYEAVAAILCNGIPWWFIGIAHFMEAGLFYPKQFKYHLHCGDPLTGRTFHVPKGRPLHNPRHGILPPSLSNPYSWEESAVDALRYMGYDKIKDWSVENCLFLFEKYNGGGYKKRKINSPYVWSYTNHYGAKPHIGKYDFDGKFNPILISKQPGVAAIMKFLEV